MRKELPIIISIIIVTIAGLVAFNLKKQLKETPYIGEFTKEKSHFIYPNFLQKMGISQPIAIDLSQQRFKGLAFLYGRGLRGVIYTKSWGEYDYFGGYALDRKGDIYLTPMPFISVNSRTFNLQKNIYRLDSIRGKLDIWMSIDKVKAKSDNPYGIIAIEYDFDDNSLWVSAIDKSSYNRQRGAIYHIDIKSRKIVQKIEGIDVLSLKLVHTTLGKYLLVGLAKEAFISAILIKDGELSTLGKKIFELPNGNQRVRKISIGGKNLIKIKTIPFAYNLIAQTERHSIRKSYNIVWSRDKREWILFK
jgi:hypothetical protein